MWIGVFSLQDLYNIIIMDRTMQESKPFYRIKKKFKKLKLNLEWWITRLVGRWRTQLTACRRVNCRTHEHRRFERKWRPKVNFRPRLAEGRFKNKTKKCCQQSISLFYRVEEKWKLMPATDFSLYGGGCFEMIHDMFAVIVKLCSLIRIKSRVLQTYSATKGH